jgi:hypothetical protein
MEHRARIRTQLRRVGITATLAALLVPAVAGTADAAKHKHKPKPKLPTITKVSPMRAAIGDTLTIRGKNFVRGARKNTVIFMRDGGRPVFVKADLATAKLIKVKLPASLTRGLKTKSGVPVATRFRLRILAKRFGRSFTTTKHSPIVDPAKAPSTDKPPITAAKADCDGDGTPNGTDTDDDNDLLPDTVEAALKTDPCSADSDADGIPDGYEYRSALDLNDDEYQNKATVPQNDVLPYPGKRPYPNPLDPSDANTDYDGDSLTQAEEYKLWQYTMANEGAPYDLERLTYSDGAQYSLYYRDANGRRHPAQAAATYDKHQQFVDWANATGYRNVWIYRGDTANWYSSYDRTNDPEYNPSLIVSPTSIFDINLDGSDDPTSSDLDGNGWISDDERDEDADGLSNYDETHGRMNPAYWSSCYGPEGIYPIHYAGTDVANPDSDGDGVRDGADDQDHDDIPNIMELSRIAASGGLDDRKGPYKADCKADVENLPKPPNGNHENAYGRVNPFNPCLPSPWSRTCAKYHDVNGGTGFAPYNDSPDWWSLN